MYLKGKLKISISDSKQGSYSQHIVEKYIKELNSQGKNKKLELVLAFYLKDDLVRYNSSRCIDDESFDEIMDSILSEDNTSGTETPKKSDPKEFTFIINYNARSFNKDITKEQVQSKIENIIKNSNTKYFASKVINIISHDTKVEKPIDAFDDMVYNSPHALKDFYGGLVNEQDIEILKETFATLKIKKKDIPNTRFNKEALLSKYKGICKNDKIAQEISRIYSIKDNKNIQGLHYLFNEDNYDIRNEEYKILASALYSMNRLDSPHYYVVEIDVRDTNHRSNFLYLRSRIKMSRNELYFFEFCKKNTTVTHDFFDPDELSFGGNSRKFFDTLRENQFTNIFGIYADEDAKNESTELSGNSLTEKLSYVVFDDKLNKEAQIEYAVRKLKLLNQADAIKAMCEVIEYQSTQNDGLSTKELDDLIISVLKSKYEKIYRPSYGHITKDLSNGNMLKKLMDMVGLKNLKAEVSEMCNKANFKNIREDLLPVTKVLNIMSNYERNHWILTGVPGTGKSTSAEMLEKIMYQEKIIKKDVIVKYTPSYTPDGPTNIFDMDNGNTSNDLRDSFSSSRGGVLIIDEIGHLTFSTGSLLLQLMEDYKRDVCVILCGYEDEAKNLLDSNPGFRSRFTHIVKLEEYTSEELYEILTRKLGEKHFTIESKASAKLKKLFNEVKTIPNFGQARFVETLCDKLISIHAASKLKQIEEMISSNSDEAIDEKEIYEITSSDVNDLPLKVLLGEDWKTKKTIIDPQKELNNLIGCNGVKEAVDEFVAKATIDKIKLDRKLIDDTGFNMNMVFYGSPGTAKTTVARLIAKIMYDKKMIKRQDVTEVGASDLVGKYVGWTAWQVAQIFSQAKGGVLFIDEAYSLANKEAGGFNQEAVDAIIKEMENNRKDTLVILAGYKDKMEELIKCNPGFKSRISKYVDFANYNIDDLLKIFKKLCKDAKYTIVEEDEQKIMEMISKYLGEIINDKQFGNGRECRTILENAINMQSKRLIDVNDISNEDLMTLKSEDFEFLNESLEFGKEKKSHVGFRLS